ncbi:MAG: hypothetical protein ACFFFH_08380 [Candidatus Thorarchaeota archaeon]
MDPSAVFVVAAVVVEGVGMNPSTIMLLEPESQYDDIKANFSEDL